MNKEKIRLYLRVLKKTIIRIINGQRKIQTKYKLTEFCSPKSDTFFGYYDITPFGNNGMIIYSILPNNSDNINVVIDHVNGGQKRILAQSYAWNWQQGCRLRWLPNNDRHISFNDFKDGKYCNRIINVEDNSERIINYPLYDIDKNSKLGLSLDYERLGRLRPGYGYTCTQIEKEKLEKQGVEIIDIQNNCLLKIIDNKRIASLFNRTVNLENCYLNHLSFSPSGKQFLFFFIEVIDNYHLASLLVYQIEDDNIVLLDEHEKVSHYVWENEDKIICTAYKDSKHCYYYRYSVNDKTKEIILPKYLNEDGHPSFFSEKCLLTDTYPNIQYFQKLLICNESEGSYRELIQIYSSPYVTGEKRTDLHPRLSDDKKFVAFDANVRGNRSFYILQID